METRYYVNGYETSQENFVEAFKAWQKETDQHLKNVETFVDNDGNISLFLSGVPQIF